MCGSGGHPRFCCKSSEKPLISSGAVPARLEKKKRKGFFYFFFFLLCRLEILPLSSPSSLTSLNALVFEDEPIARRMTCTM